MVWLDEHQAEGQKWHHTKDTQGGAEDVHSVPKCISSPYHQGVRYSRHCEVRALGVSTLCVAQSSIVIKVNMLTAWDQDPH